MFFQAFRPRGEGVEAAFEGVVGADRILPRLLEVYEATAEGWQRDGSYDWYFTVRHPRPLAAQQAEALAREYLEKVAEIVRTFDEEDEDDSVAELLGALDRRPLVEVVRGERPWPPGDEAPEGLIYELTGDFIYYLGDPVESHAHLMREAFYTLACDYDILHHILWPLYEDLTPISEPFAAYFQLWQHGAGLRFEGLDRVRVYVPNLAE